MIHYNHAMMTCFLAWYYNNNGLAIRIALQSMMEEELYTEACTPLGLIKHKLHTRDMKGV